MSKPDSIIQLLSKISPIVFFLLLTSLTLLQFQSTAASTMVEVAVEKPGDLELLLTSGLDVVYISDGQMAEVLLHSEAEKNRLRATGLYYFTLHENAEQYYSERLKDGQARDDMGGYPTFDEIVERIFDWHDDYPDIIGEPVSIGSSIEERDIWAFRLSDNPNEDEDEPEVLYVSLIHSREAITSLVLSSFVNRLIDGYEEEDERITELVDNRQMWFILCQNPDGLAYNEEIEPDGGGMWRKNRRENEGGSFGVDLNRNWGYEWGYDDIGSSPVPDHPIYRGTEAFSEPETQAVREFVNDRNFSVSLYFHSYSNLCLLPPAYDYFFAEDRSLLSALAKNLTVDNGYLPGTGWETIYRVNGDSDDWLYHADEHDPIMAFTIEVGSRQDNFWPPRNRMQPLIEENLTACITAAEYCDNPSRVLLPPSPLDVSVDLSEQQDIVVSWEEPEDEDNPPQSYRVTARTQPEPITDEAEPDQERWELLNFTMSDRESHSGSHSFSLNLREPMATLSLREELVCPDTLWAWMFYDLFRFWNHYIALEVSYDGFEWEPVPGRDTQDLVMNGVNLGPGINGSSDDEWVRTWFNLSDHAGETVRLRFRFYQFSRRSNREKCYIDDIYPVPDYEWSEVVAEGIEETQWIDEDNDVRDELEYVVQSVDADADLSLWSSPATLEVGPDDFWLDGQMGWMLYSIPLVTDPNELDHLFAPWIEADVLLLVKNQLGQFFAPRFDFNQIDEWNPLEGYWIKLSAAQMLFVDGEWASPDSEIPLRESWNSVAYLHRDPMPEIVAFENVSDNLILAKDGYGRFWINEFNFSNMGDLQLGRGYQLLMAENDTLIYPAIDELVGLTPYDRGENEFIRITAEHNFIPPSEHNHSLLLRFNLPLVAGELVLLDSEDSVSGMVSVSDGQTLVGIAAWSENDLNKAGYEPEERFRLEYHSQDSHTFDVTIKSQIVGEDRYTRDGFSLLEVSVDGISSVPGSYTLTSYPNPFNSTAKLQYHLIEPGDVILTTFDSVGRTVTEVAIGQKTAGQHSIEWHADNMPSGIYIAQISVTSAERTDRLRTKMLLLR